MQLGSKGTDATVSGSSGQMMSMKVEASAIGFEILYSGIYSDKPRAVIRELSCNSQDSHVSAGKSDIPFEVHLPTIWEPWFSLRDFGTGLKFIKGGCEKCTGSGVFNSEPCFECNGTGDYDAVVQLYCTYFASDKNQSNDMIGGFGLGSKSPFAYTNKRKADGTAVSGGFDVTNIYNGRKYIYSALVKNGFPSVVMLHQQDTEEGNGVEVSFPVDSNDIAEFENKAAEVYEFFDPHPVLNKPIQIHKPEYSVRTSLWGMRKDGKGLRAIMGKVQYTVGNIDISRLSPGQQKMVSMPIDLFFNIGELSPHVSREILQMDDGTTANILKRLDVVQDALMDEFRKKIDTCTSVWEAHMTISELINTEGIGVIVKEAFNKGQLFGKYTKFRLDSSKVFFNELDYNYIQVHQYLRDATSSAKSRKAHKKSLFQSRENRLEAFTKISKEIVDKSAYDVDVYVTNNTAVIINATDKPVDKYVNYLVQHDKENQYTKILVISRASKNTPLNLVEGEAKKLFNQLGNPPSFELKDLKAKYDPVFDAEKKNKVYLREKRSIRVLKGYVRGGSYARRWYQSNGGNWRNAWDAGDLWLEKQKTSDRKFYIIFDNSRTKNTGYEHSNANSLVSLVNKMKASPFFPELADMPIFGIKENSPLLKDETFIELFPYMRKKAESIVTLEKMAEMSLAVYPFRTGWIWLLRYVMKHPQVLSHNSPFYVFSNMLATAEKVDRTEHGFLVDLANSFNIKLETQDTLNKAWSKVLGHYPMLKICESTPVRDHSSDSIQESNIMVDYIRYIDAKNCKLKVAVTMAPEDEAAHV